MSLPNSSSFDPKQPEACNIAMLRDLDASGVTAALPKLLSHPPVAAKLRKLSAGAPASAQTEAPGDSCLGASVACESGDLLVLIGGTTARLEGSQFLEVFHGLKMDAVPAVDPGVEKLLEKIVQTLIETKIASAVCEVDAGGLLVTLVEMLCPLPSFGAKLDLTAFGATRSDLLLFGRYYGCVLVAVRAERVGTVLSEAITQGAPAVLIGEITTEPELLASTRRLSVKWPVAMLRAAFGANNNQPGARPD